MSILVPNIKLSNGIEMPQLGLGTYPMTGEVLSSAVIDAYNNGYRLIDSSDNYFNEEDLGHALKLLYTQVEDATRENLFIVSKVSDELYPPGSLRATSNMGKYFWRTSSLMQKPDAVRKVVNDKINSTLKALGTDYLDLYLMHWPYPDYFEEIWQCMEDLYQDGKVRAIGVCNCRERHLRYLKDHCRIQPMVNQIETSPINTKESLIRYCSDNGICVMVYSPLMSLRCKQYPRYQQCLNSIAEKHGVSISQVILRFDIQRGLVPIPKSSNNDRLLNNISVFHFNLDDEDINLLMSCNVNHQYMPESRECPGL